MISMETSIRVLNPKRLNDWEIPCKRIALGEPGDYKPSIAMLPNGDIVMTAFYGETLENGKYIERTVLWKSSDGGSTWTDRKVLEDIIGREQWLTSTYDGILFATSHILDNDINNKDGFSHSYLHRSVDNGNSWERFKIVAAPEESKMSNAEYGHSMTSTSRNIIEMPDGVLFLGVSVSSSKLAWFMRSDDKGCTWGKMPYVKIAGYYDNVDGFFSEDFTYRTSAGKMLHFIRVGPPSPMYPMTDAHKIPKTDDQGDRTMICESYDNGKSWVNLKDFGDYGMMYPRVLPLADGRLLLTYTQRGLFYPLGLRATISYDDGETWDLNSDIIIIEGKTPWGKISGGGFGNTLQLSDNSLVSCYTYNGEDDLKHLEIVKWYL